MNAPHCPDEGPFEPFRLRDMLWLCMVFPFAMIAVMIGKDTNNV